MKKVLRSLLLGLMIFAIIAVSVACTNTAQTTTSEAATQSSTESTPQQSTAASEEQNGTIKIGMVIPLTGDMAWSGEAFQAIAQYRVDKENESGGIGGKKIELIVVDDQGQSANSVTAVQKLISIDKVDAIYGPAFTSNIVACKDIINKNKTVMIEPTSANPAVFEDNGYIFSIDVSPDVAEKAHCDYLIKEKGFKTIALFGAYSDQTLSMIDAFNKYWVEYGGEIVFSNTFNGSTTDFRTDLTKIKALKPDVLWFTGTADNAANIVRQAQELGFDESTWICTDSTAVDDNFYANFGSFIDGHFNYTQTGVPGDDVTQKMYDDVTKDFTASGGEITPVTYLGYDCFNILLTAMQNAAASGDDLRNAMLKLDSLPGTTGYTTFNSNGSSNRSVLMNIYQNGQESHETFK